MKKLRGGLIRQNFIYNNKEIPYEVITNRRLKHLYITISPSSGVIVKNPNFSQKKVQEIVEAKARWIYKKLEDIREIYRIKEIYQKEGKILYLGKKIALHVEELESFYRSRTQRVVSREIKSISKATGLTPNRVSFRKTKRRWGSCNYKNELNFTISLVQLPIKTIRYVIMHELAHIKHKNHKKEFYETIKSYIPNFKVQESILKKYSPSLD